MLQRISHLVIRIMALCILGFLTANSFFHTQRYGIEGVGEILNGAPIYKEADNILLHLLVIAVFVFVLWLLYGEIGSIRFATAGSQRAKIMFPNWILIVLQSILALAGGVFSLCLLLDGTRPPMDDQIQVYSAAMLFNEGNFANLTPGGYVEMYPQQLGYILYLQVLFRLFGTTSYVIVQKVNCIFIAGILWTLFQVLNHYVHSNGVRILGSVLMALNLPIYFLHTWVYGDVPFFFFALVFLYLWLRTEEKIQADIKIHWTAIAGLLLTACAMLLFRKNALVVLLGAFLLLMLHGFIECKRVCIILSLGVILVPLLLSHIVTVGYEKVSGYGPLRGLPGTCWIAMGMIEGQSKPGWFNNYGVPTYYENDCDYEATAKQAKGMIGWKTQEFLDNPGMAVSFYKRKICTQWNDPYYNTKDLITGKGVVKEGISGWLERRHKGVERLLDAVQLLTYLGALFYVLFGIKKNLLSSLPELLLVGGFLFSILWEGNSRYIYPYVLIIMPAAIYGWYVLYEKINNQIIAEKHRKMVGETAGRSEI